MQHEYYVFMNSYNDPLHQPNILTRCPRHPFGHEIFTQSTELCMRYSPNSGNGSRIYKIWARLTP